MEESQAIKKFRTVLRQFDLDDEVKIDFYENELAGFPGAVQVAVEYHISLDKELLTDPEKLETGWTARMADFPAGVVPCLPKEDRVFLVFLHEVGHIVNGHCYEDYSLGDSQEADEGEQEACDKANKQEQVAWDFAWRVYRAYMAGQERTD